MVDEWQHLDNYNSWEYVTQLRAEKSSTDSVISGMEHIWKLIEQKQNHFKFDLDSPGSSDLLAKCDEIVSVTPLDSFLASLHFGRYPSPEVLLAIARCFQLYFEGAGRVELEDVFFKNPRKQRVGNNAAQKNSELRYESFALYFELQQTLWSENEKKSDKASMNLKPTLGKTAEDFLNRRPGQNLDVESFLRGYQRWKKGVTATKPDY